MKIENKYIEVRKPIRNEQFHTRDSIGFYAFTKGNSAVPAEVLAK